MIGQIRTTMVQVQSIIIVTLYIIKATVREGKPGAVRHSAERTSSTVVQGRYVYILYIHCPTIPTLCEI